MQPATRIQLRPGYDILVTRLDARLVDNSLKRMRMSLECYWLKLAEHHSTFSISSTI